MFQPTTKEGKKAAQNLDNAKSELRSAKDNAKSAVRGEFDNATDSAEEKVRNLRDTAREAGERVQHFLHDRRDDVSHAKESAERQIRANPIAAAGILLAAGAILGRLLKR